MCATGNQVWSVDPPPILMTGAWPGVRLRTSWRNTGSSAAGSVPVKCSSDMDSLSDVCRLLFVDLRAQGRSAPAPPETWTLTQMAADIEALAQTLELDRYAVLGHSFGSFVALQHAVDFAGRPAASIISAGVP